MPSPASRRRPLLALLLLFACGALAAYLLWPHSPAHPHPGARTLAANTRGVGRMERFEYAEATREFEEVVRLAPDWLPARVNLGIAIFNQNTLEAVERAREVFTEVLARDPDHKHAHYCLGVICSTYGPFAEAYPHFTAVNKLDPDDAHTWHQLGLTHPAGKRSAEATACFEEAVKRNPYLNAARYNLSQSVSRTDPKRAAALDAEMDALRKAVWEDEADIRYSA